MTEPKRIVSLVTGSVAQHPYIRLLHQALEGAGIEVDPRQSLSVRELRVLARENVTAVHLHWPDFLGYNSTRPVVGPLFTHLLAARTLVQLNALQGSPVRFVWTVHDLLPHDARHPRLEQRVFSAAAKADGLLVHSAFAAERVREQFSQVGPMTVAPHPNFDGYYPEPIRPVADIRRELGFGGDECVYLMFGHVRPYKQIAAAIRTFALMEDPDARLLVVGKASDDQQAREVEAAAAGDARIVLRLGFVPDELVAAYHRASDVAVFNHREIFTSGALMLALTFGLPVVAPAGGTTSEVVGPPAAELFAPDDLGRALVRIREGDPATRRAGARAASDACSWDRMVRALLPLYGADEQTP